MTDSAPIGACIFDVDGTLYDAQSLRRAMAIRLVSAHVTRPFSGYRNARILSAYRRAHETLRQRGCALESATDQLTLCCELTGETADTVQGCIREFFDDAPLDLLPRFIRPGLVDFLAWARRNGVRLGVFSDYPAERKLRVMGLREYFDVVACAQDPQVRRMKPDPAGLNYVRNRLGTPALRTLYVGDRTEVDGESAAAAGMQAAIVGQHAARASSTCFSIRHFSELTRYWELDYAASASTSD